MVKIIEKCKLTAEFFREFIIIWYFGLHLGVWCVQ